MEKLIEKDRNTGKKTFSLWTKRYLSIIGKILIVKILRLNLSVHHMQSIGMHDNVFCRIIRIMFRFIWITWYTNTRVFEKIRRSVLASPFKFGGLNNYDNVKEKQTSNVIQWAKKLIRDKNKARTRMPYKFLEGIGGIWVFQANERLTLNLKSILE